MPISQIEASLGESSVNVPVSDDFGYRALGLKDGDLVLDEERGVAYLVSGDTTERLCDYGEVTTLVLQAVFVAGQGVFGFQRYLSG